MIWKGGDYSECPDLSMGKTRTTARRETGRRGDGEGKSLGSVRRLSGTCLHCEKIFKTHETISGATDTQRGIKRVSNGSYGASTLTLHIPRLLSLLLPVQLGEPEQIGGKTTTCPKPGYLPLPEPYTPNPRPLNPYI